LSSGFDIHIESGIKAMERLREYRKVAKRVKEIAEKWFPGSKVLVFGSVVRGECTAASDIDILVVVAGDMERERALRFKAEVYREVDAPIELHVASEREFREWYARFMEEYEEV